MTLHLVHMRICVRYSGNCYDLLASCAKNKFQANNRHNIKTTITDTAHKKLIQYTTFEADGFMDHPVYSQTNCITIFYNQVFI